MGSGLNALLSMTLNLPDILITAVAEKMPAPVRELLAENQPVPPDVAFYEQRLTASALTKRIAIAAVLFLIAVLLLISSLEFLYLRHVDPKYQRYVNIKELAAAVAFGYGGWLMLSSVNTGRALARRQAAGERTRLGVFLLSDTFVCHSQFDTTMVPRGNFQGLSGGKVNYSLNNAPKSFNLPDEWVGVSAVEVHQAIGAWGQTAPPPPPPPTVV